MEPLHKYFVFSYLPEPLEGLRALARNYWFSWNAEIENVFRSIDPQLWKDSDHNPIWVLSHAPQERLNHLGADTSFVAKVQKLVEDQKKYLETPSPFTFCDVPKDSPAVAYFSLEFGVSQCLPIYSGGLGLLAGDHLKSASDLNVPLIGMGLAYSQGYFRQYMTVDGWQQERYPDYDYSQMPLQLVRKEDGSPIYLEMIIGKRMVKAQIFRADVGRVALYLLDTNLTENPVDVRQLTSRLYGGNLDMRLQQEILLGIGGVRALKLLGLNPHVLHMNEGHCAFGALERIRLLMHEQHLSFEEAQVMCFSGGIFTTHTPVPAGNDYFPIDLMRQYFSDYAGELGLSFEKFIALGRQEALNESEMFCMTVLALRLCAFSNGVSKLHGKVSRNMWHKIWPQYPIEDVPIHAVTNGVHAPSWVAPELRSLYDRYLGENWREGTDLRVWERIADIPDIEFWRAHERLRARLVEFIRKRLHDQYKAQGLRRSELEKFHHILNPEALTIGFARRFATYKRAQLLFHDIDALRRIVRNADCPVQFVFAGKAHPADNAGKQLMKDIINLCASEDFRGNMVFLEDYDIDTATYLISGCDVWLNNPRRPLEACGTSGMKAMFNGVLQFSTLDGWWDEAWMPDNSCGWAIGQGEEYDDPAYQDTVERQTLYKRLERDIIPDFYERSSGGMPYTWVKRMKNALVQFGPRFHSHRMVLEYFNEAYIPACFHYVKLGKDNFALAKNISNWYKTVAEKWRAVEIKDVEITPPDALNVGQSIKVRAKVFLAGIDPEHVRVDLYIGPLGHDGSYMERQLEPMRPEGEPVDGWQSFRGVVYAGVTGRFGLNVRVMPSHSSMANSQLLGLIRWANR